MASTSARQAGHVSVCSPPDGVTGMSSLHRGQLRCVAIETEYSSPCGRCGLFPLYHSRVRDVVVQRAALRIKADHDVSDIQCQIAQHPSKDTDCRAPIGHSRKIGANNAHPEQKLSGCAGEPSDKKDLVTKSESDVDEDKQSLQGKIGSELWEIFQARCAPGSGDRDHPDSEELVSHREWNRYNCQEQSVQQPSAKANPEPAIFSSFFACRSFQNLSEKGFLAPRAYGYIPVMNGCFLVDRPFAFVALDRRPGEYFPKRLPGVQPFPPDWGCPLDRAGEFKCLEGRFLDRTTRLSVCPVVPTHTEKGDGKEVRRQRPPVCGPAVDLRTISSGSNAILCTGLLPRSRASKSSIVLFPIFSIGCATTVRGGSM